MATDLPVPSAQGPATAAPPAEPPWRKLLAEALGGIPVVGKVLKFLVENRLWGALAAGFLLLLLLVVYPLLVPYLAARLVESGVTLGLQSHYVSTIRSAFKVRELADDANRELNARLDYFHFIEITGDPRHSRHYEIPIAPMQKVEIQLGPGNLSLRGGKKKCQMPPAFSTQGYELMTVKVQGQKLMAVTNQGAAQDLKVSAEDWGRWQGGLKDRLVLAFDPVADVRNTDCEGLDIAVRVYIKVYKDLLPSVVPVKTVPTPSV